MRASTAARPSAPRASRSGGGIAADGRQGWRTASRAEDDVVEAGDLAGRRQRRCVVGQAGVVVEPAQIGQHAGGRLGRLLRLTVGERRQPMGEEWNGATQVGELEADP